MKNFIKQWILIFGLVVISSCIIPSIINNDWTISSFIIKLLVVTLVMCFLNLVINKLPIELPIMKHLVRMCTILGLVYVFGWFWNWYSAAYWWIILAMVIPVYVIYYLVENAKVEKDVDWINQQIKSRNKHNQGDSL